MGRHSGGFISTSQCKKIELSYLIKANIIQKNRAISTTIKWTDDGNITLKAYCNDFEKYLLLEYTHTDLYQNKTELSYKIRLVALPSNLGKGEVLYMVCPTSGRLCRKLFMAYGSPYFKSIKAYNTRIYYTCQQSSRFSRNNDKYWHLFNYLENHRQRNQSHYRGIETKRNIRMGKLYERLEYLDNSRWQDMPVRLKRVFNYTDF
jgi:hypothetical protein